MEKKRDKKSISRRNFLKTAGAAAIVAAGLSTMPGRGDRKRSTAGDSEPSGEMTYRTNPKTGEKVSILGYGCMRWPTLYGSADDELDQEQVNRLVDYAIAHGVNYFDTSPAYCKGQSERVTGNALKRHPRDKFFIATKLSNFDPSTWSHDGSMKIYRHSFEALQVDYIDYYLLHGVGMGRDGMAELRAKYIDNDMLDFLLKEREAGRIRNLGFSYHGDIKVRTMTSAIIMTMSISSAKIAPAGLPFLRLFAIGITSRISYCFRRRLSSKVSVTLYARAAQIISPYLSARGMSALSSSGPE